MQHSLCGYTMNIEVEQIGPGILHLKFPTNHDMHLGLMRFSDFYEGDKLKGKFFDHETLIRTWIQDYKQFDLFESVAGYNLTDRDVRKFFQKFKEESLWDIEKDIKEALSPYLKKKDKFCVIGCTIGDDITFNHEAAHGFYYLDKEYKKDMDKLVNGFRKDQKAQIMKGLEELGYIKKVLMDEAQAFLSTSTMGDLHYMFGNLDWNKVLKLQLRLQKELEGI